MDLIVEHCPRCLARRGRVSELHLSDEARLFSGMPVGEPPEPGLGDSSDANLDEAADAEIKLSRGPHLETSSDVLDESAEAEIELPSIPQFG
jgi:hypothetical protein